MTSFQPSGKLKFIDGSILAPHHAGLRFVLSINNMGGKTNDHPLYPTFDKKWKKVKEEAKGWYVNKTGEYKLGATYITAVQSDTWVIHMLCQDEDLKTNTSALEDCLKKVCSTAKYEQASIHVSNLLTAAVPELQDLLTKYLVEKGINVSIYKD